MLTRCGPRRESEGTNCGDTDPRAACSSNYAKVGDGVIYAATHGAPMSTLLVASTGGHLRELHRLLPRLPLPDDDVVWVTNDTVQGRVLLAGQKAIFVQYQGSRNITATMLNVGLARRLISSCRFHQAFSTGSAIAMSFLPVAAVGGVHCHYIESATRVASPSLTGRILRWSPGVHCYAQHRRFDRGAWHYGGSVLEGFFSLPKQPPEIRQIVVTLGTWRQGFRRLVQRLIKIIPPSVETLWQTGYTDVSDMPIRSVPWLPPDELQTALRQADVVVTHAGMGATLDALEAGKLPVLVPRRCMAGEQVDDHQVELASELSRLGLAVAKPADELCYGDLLSAASWKVGQSDTLPPFLLQRPREELSGS